MILKTKEFKQACQDILFAIDRKGKDEVLFNETLELKAEGSELTLNVTNRIYYTSVKFNLDSPQSFNVPVNARKFLSLISKITTETIELTTEGNTLKIKGNGSYTLPMIFNGSSKLELPKIDIDVITTEFDISNDILLSILENNSKELSRGVPAKAVQEYYYIDEFGAITFTSGACVNSFTLPSPVKLLLHDKVVRLFKLFKNRDNIHLTLGHSSISDDLTVGVVRFSTDNVIITTKLGDNGMISSVPVSAVRGMATGTYPYNMVFDREALLQAIDRVLVFNTDLATLGFLNVDGSNLTIEDESKSSYEVVMAVGENKNTSKYSFVIDLANMKNILEGNGDQYITVCFGNSKSVAIKKPTVVDLIPEFKVA